MCCLGQRDMQKSLQGRRTW
nr:unnamed protein product [Callosobruchus analis]